MAHSNTKHQPKPLNAEPEAIVDSLSVAYPATFTIESVVNFRLYVPCARFELEPGETVKDLYFETEQQHKKFTDTCNQIKQLMGVPELVRLTYNGGD